MLDGRKDKGANLAVGREPDARAGAAKWLGYRGDDADFAGRAITEPVTRRSLGTASHLERLERKSGFDAMANLAARNHIFAGPVVTGIERHKLNEPHFYIMFTSEGGKVSDLILVMAADHDR